MFLVWNISHLNNFFTKLDVNMVIFVILRMGTNIIFVYECYIICLQYLYVSLFSILFGSFHCFYDVTKMAFVINCFALFFLLLKEKYLYGPSLYHQQYNLNYINKNEFCTRR